MYLFFVKKRLRFYMVKIIYYIVYGEDRNLNVNWMNEWRVNGLRKVRCRKVVNKNLGYLFLRVLYFVLIC